MRISHMGVFLFAAVIAPALPLSATQHTGDIDEMTSFLASAFWSDHGKWLQKRVINGIMRAKTGLTGDFRPCFLAVRTHNREERMPRANRYLLPDHVCHVTHRCHDRSYCGLRGIVRDTAHACGKPARQPV